MLEQLFANLFSKISGHIPGNSSVRVSLDSLDNSSTLVIKDAGPGLPQDAYGSIPQQFKRFDKSRSRETGGSELGISIMAALLHKHGGKINLLKANLVV